MGTTIRRAVVIGNGIAGAENQCIGLIRALVLPHTLFRVTRPKGGINDRLRWLPVSLHKKLQRLHLQGTHGVSSRLAPLPMETEGFPGIVEADAHFIAKVARDTFDKDGPTLVVASGRDTISLASSIKWLAPENVFVVQVREGSENHLNLFFYSCCRNRVGVCNLIFSCSILICFFSCFIKVVYKLRQWTCTATFLTTFHLMSCFQIQHPRSKLNRFDLVITPRHDYYPLTPEGQQQIPWFLRGWITPREPPDRHVVLTVGALHQADSIALQTAASFWHDELAVLPKPLLVVNIGGPTSHCRYGVDLAKQLTASLLQVLSTCGSLRISFSRRTPKQVSDILVRELGNHPKVYIWNGEGTL